MSIEKFEVGKKYRFLKDGDGDTLYNGVDAEIGQEFTVHEIDDEEDIYTKDVTFQGSEETVKGWIVYGNYPQFPTTLEDFEEVEDVTVLTTKAFEKVESIINNLPREVTPEMKKLFSEGVGDIVGVGETSDILLEEENIPFDLIKEVTKLQQDHNLVLMFHGGEVVVSFENNDTEYQISSQGDLTTLIESSKVMKRFERKVNYND